MKQHRKPRRCGRWTTALLLSALPLSALLVTSCINPLSGVDFLTGLKPLAARATNAPARRTVVVLQHGMLRTAWSLWRLERALEQHGFEVFNPSYPSTSARIEDHAAALEAGLEAYLRDHPGPAPDLGFVGHSMGGLVIRAYLARPTARHAQACVFLGTPHRGAQLATAVRDTTLFRVFGGTKAALQLLPDDPFYDTLPRLQADAIGCIYGYRGDGEGWSTTIPGEDDKRVSVAEAQLPEQTDVKGMRVNHTWLPVDDAVIDEVLTFLRDGRFR